MILSKVINHFFLMIHKYELEKNLIYEEAPDNFEFVWTKVSSSNLNLIDDLAGELPPAKMQSLKDRSCTEGFSVYLYVDNQGKTAGYCCTSVNDTYESGMRKNVTVPFGYLYCFDDYVKIRYRGKGIHKRMVQNRAAICRQNDLNGMVYIYHNNVKSICNYKSAGFKLTGRIFCIRPLRITITF